VNKPLVHLIYGPPGTGKTTRIVSLVKSEIENGAWPTRIGAISFTKAAASEVYKRVRDFGLRKKWTCTVHSMAFKMSRMSSSQVIGHGELMEFSRQCGIEMTCANPDESDYICDGDEYLAIYSLAKSDGSDVASTYDRSHRPGTREVFLWFCDEYDAYKRGNGFLDFNDILITALCSNKTPGIDILFVDEAQDLSPIQWALINKWTRNIDKVYIAGDDDQAIYVWGGADPHGMARYQQKYGGTSEVLKKSHRLPSVIHKFAHNFIRKIKNRVDKEYMPRDHMGEISVWTSSNVKLDIKHGDDVLMLYRNHKLRADIEILLLMAGIPYIVDYGLPGSLQSRYASVARIWMAINTIEKLNTADLSIKQFQRMKKVMTPDSRLMLEKQMFEQLNGKHWTEVLYMPDAVKMYLMDIESKYGLDVVPTVHMSTIHGSKGREADRVVLLNSMGQKTAQSFLKDPDPEIRTFYVALTRARKRLDIIEGSDPMPYIMSDLMNIREKGSIYAT